MERPDGVEASRRLEVVEVRLLVALGLFQGRRTEQALLLWRLSELVGRRCRLLAVEITEQTALFGAISGAASLGNVEAREAAHRLLTSGTKQRLVLLAKQASAGDGALIHGLHIEWLAGLRCERGRLRFLLIARALGRILLHDLIFGIFLLGWRKEAALVVQVEPAKIRRATLKQIIRGTRLRTK